MKHLGEVITSLEITIDKLKVQINDLEKSNTELSSSVRILSERISTLE